MRTSFAKAAIAALGLAMADEANAQINARNIGELESAYATLHETYTKNWAHFTYKAETCTTFVERRQYECEADKYLKMQNAVVPFVNSLRDLPDDDAAVLFEQARQNAAILNAELSTIKRTDCGKRDDPYGYVLSDFITEDDTIKVNYHGSMRRVATRSTFPREIKPGQTWDYVFQMKIVDAEKDLLHGVPFFYNAGLYMAMDADALQRVGDYSVRVFDNTTQQWKVPKKEMPGKEFIGKLLQSAVYYLVPKLEDAERLPHDSASELPQEFTQDAGCRYLIRVVPYEVPQLQPSLTEPWEIPTGVAIKIPLIWRDQPREDFHRVIRATISDPDMLTGSQPYDIDRHYVTGMPPRVSMKN